MCKLVKHSLLDQTMYWSILRKETACFYFRRLLFFFQNRLFQKIISGVATSVRNQIRTDLVSLLIWVETVLQNLSADDTCRQRVNAVTISSDTEKFRPLKLNSSKLKSSWQKILQSAVH